MNAATRSAVAHALAAGIVSASKVAGGDINDGHVVELTDGRRVFVKSNPRAPAQMFTAEARGLAWLAEAAALRVPSVLAVSSPDAGQPQFLVLEHLESAPPRATFDAELGRGLALLHQSGAPRLGLEHDNFIGTLPQSNSDTQGGTWAAFYRDRRVLPLAERAAQIGRIDTPLRRKLDRLCDRLPGLVGPPEPPARLHGDLWRGNVHTGPLGEPCLIDPAAYAGHREVDLAMMRLFGGFSERTFLSYDEAFPLSPGHGERVRLYQIYPLLVHVNLFGGHYAQSLATAVNTYV